MAVRMKLRYCGVEFELDTEGMRRWLNDPVGRKTSRLDGSWGHPSDAGWNAPTWREYFSDMTHEEMKQHIIENFNDGAMILDSARPKRDKSGEIQGILLIRDIFGWLEKK